jgi:glycine betaine/proline transport system substrate-binding protein
MKKLPLILAAGAFAAPMAAQAQSGDCGEVSVAEMNWASGQIITGITAFLMEQGYGCDVKIVQSATTTAITSLAENNEPDVVPELWVNSAQAYFRLEEEGKVRKAADVFAEGGSENWWVPAYLVEEHPELATIEGILENPELVGGRFHNCPDGWGCRIANDNLVEAFEFEKHGMEVFDHGSGETLPASMAAAYENREPWFGYYWGPTAVLGRYDMVAVDMGPYDAEIHACNQTQDCETPGKSAYPAAPVLTVVTTDFAERNPEVFELVSNISFGTQELSNLLAWQKENSASAEEAAVHYLTNFQDQWSGWLSDEARRNLTALLDQ